MAYKDVRLPECIRYGATGEVAFSTDVVTAQSGWEQRISNWVVARSSWDIEYVRKEEDMHMLRDFFRACRGQQHTFRFKDPTDYTVKQSESTFLQVGNFAPFGGFPTARIAKKYSLDGTDDGELRPIIKPVSSTFKMYKNGVETATGWTMDYQTGVVTFDPVVPSRNISSFVVGATTTINFAAAHGFTNNTNAYFTMVGGTAADKFNGKALKITVTSATQITVAVNTTGLTASAGVVTIYPQAPDNWKFECEYDMLVRFDTDKLNVSVTDKGIYTINSLRIIEVRQ